MKPNKLELSSVDGTQLNLEALYQIAPSCFTEVKDDETGELRHVVNFKTLRQLLGDDAVEDADEMYQFTWPGKQEARRKAARPTTKTLRPVVEDSVDWDNTQNLYIEGDNLEVLKLLQKSYMGKVKMIYIDPPYNTGNDFVYDDDFAVSKDEYDLFAGDVDELGNRYRKNTDTNGRFHSDWCSMMCSRLIVAYTLLREDGVIMISIDDNEVHNLRKICDEVFGSANFIAECVRKRRNSQANLSKNISPIHEYIVIYAKKYGDILNKVAANLDESAYKNPDNDPRGLYVTMPCTNKGGAVYTVTTPTGNQITEEWRFKKETYDSLMADNRLVFPRGGEGKPRYKLFLSEKKAEGQLANTWFDALASNQEATREIKEIFDDYLVFDTPKPVGLLTFCIQLGGDKDSLILDFFSGSATTAHAVMKLNAEDGGTRKYICIQLDENTPENSDARKAGYETITDIAKERIRRAGKLIKNDVLDKLSTELESLKAQRALVEPDFWCTSEELENKIKALEEKITPLKSLDTGFRVFRLSDSNFEEVNKAPNEYDQSQLDLFLNNVKSDRTDLDLLFGVMLNWGVQLSLPMTSEEVDGKMIYSVNEGDLVACFAEDVTEDIVKKMAEKQPLRVLFRDSCFARDDAKINVFETLKQMLDWSEEEAMMNIKVI